MAEQSAHMEGVFYRMQRAAERRRARELRKAARPSFRNTLALFRDLPRLLRAAADFERD